MKPYDENEFKKTKKVVTPVVIKKSFVTYLGELVLYGVILLILIMLIVGIKYFWRLLW